MELKVLEEDKSRLLLQIKGEDHTLCNVLKDELWNDKNIKASAFRIKHPLVGIPEILSETNGKEDPRKALINAAKRLEKEFEKCAEIAKKELK